MEPVDKGVEMTVGITETMTIEKHQEQAKNNYEEIVELKNVVGASYIILGKLLKENQDNLYWKTLGFKTFDSFIATGELAFHRSTVYKLIRIYKEYVERFGVDEKDIKDIESDKLEMVIPFLNKTNVQQWIEKARMLSRSDLRDEIQGKKTQNKLDNGMDWREFTDVWKKTQPISRWGATPRDSIFGQFAANIVHYFTKKSDTVVDVNSKDSAVEDVCKELKRKVIRLEEGELITGKEGELAIYIADLNYGIPNSVGFLTRLVKEKGNLAVYFKGNGFSEESFYDAVSVIAFGDGTDEFVPVRTVTVYERPTGKELTISLKNNALIEKTEKIVIFTKRSKK